MNPKTPSDLLFEDYLKAHGREDFVYEEPLPGSSKVPDYQLRADPKPLLFEVKSFDVEPTKGFGYFDPYGPTRRKITKAAEKFKQLEGYSCSLVLHYDGPGLIMLEPWVILGAMLGDIGFEIPFDQSTQALEAARSAQVFGKDGRMIQYSKGGIPDRPVNTRINSVIVIEQYPLGQKRFGKYYDALRAERAENAGSLDAALECYGEVRAARGTERDVSLRVVRAVVVENPYAPIPLRRDLFVGPCDERFGADPDGRITRLFAGPTVADLGDPALGL
jgi:hypothetical protein